MTQREPLFSFGFRCRNLAASAKNWLARKAGWWSWKVYGNVRWYWPRAQSRRRVLASFRAQIEAVGEDWPTYRRECLSLKPWWLP